MLHRVVNIDDMWYYCKGDNAKRVEKIQENQIVGTLSKAIRGGICVYEKEEWCHT